MAHVHNKMVDTHIQRAGMSMEPYHSRLISLKVSPVDHQKVHLSKTYRTLYTHQRHIVLQVQTFYCTSLQTKPRSQYPVIKLLFWWKMLCLYLITRIVNLLLTLKSYLRSESYSRKYETLPNIVIFAC